MRVSLPSMALTIFLMSLVGRPAFAQQPSGAADAGIAPYPECKTTPTEAESEAAHGAYLAGKGSFDEADYTTAVTYFKDAYRRDCTKPELLSALSRAYELKGDRAQAIHALETYLRRAPANNPNNEGVQRRLAALKAQTAPPPSTTPPVTSAGSPSQSPPQPAPPSADRASRERQHTVYPWIIAGAGAVLAGVGISLVAVGTGQVNTSKEDAAAAGCTDTRCPAGVDIKPFQDKNDSGTTQRNIGGVLVGVGAAAIVGGVIWYFVEPTVARKAKVKAHPDFGAGYAGIALGASF